MVILLLFSLIFVLALTKQEINQIIIIKATSFTFLITIFLILNVFNISSELKINIFNSIFYLNSLNIFIIFFIISLSILLILPWSSDILDIYKLKNNKFYNTITPLIKEYSIIIIFTSIGAIFLINSNSLISLFLTVELQSFGVYILASIYRESETSTAAGLKYYLLGGLSSCMILLGSALIYNSIGNIFFQDIFINFSIFNYISNSNYLAIIGFIILISGLIFKISAAPFHSWAPDVYSGVSLIIITWLSIMPKISIFMILVNFSLNFNNINFIAFNLFNINFNFFILLILVFSFLSLIVGAVSGIYQNNIKRLLAFSTILNVGFILLSLATPNINGLKYFIFYLIQYSVTSLVIFFVLLAFSYFLYNNIYSNNLSKSIYNKNKSNFDINYISELIGLSRQYPLIIFSLLMCMFSLAGVPPFVGFFAKIGVLIGALDSGYFFISIIAIVVSVISAFYYLRVVKLAYFDNYKNNNLFNNNNNNNNTLELLTNTHSYLISIFSIVLVFYSLEPNIILNTLNVISLNFYFT